jgi:hypothetical protein
LQADGFQVTVTPGRVLADNEHKAPVVIVPVVLEKRDVFWAMNVLVHFKKYNELCAERGDFILDYYVMDKSMAGIGQSLSAGDFGDPNRIFFDISVLEEIGAKVADIPGLDWQDQDRTNHDPDAQIEHIGFIPVLNIAGKREARPNFSLGPKDRGQFPGILVSFDAQRVEHGLLGEHWMEGISFAFNHGKDDDPAIEANFERMGLIGGERAYKGERYFMYVPMQAIEQGTKLPLVLINSEISYSNPYSISSTYANYLDYFKLAASGNLNILIFNIGTPQAMDHAYELIKQLERTEPVDSSRIYVTGHSHMGFEGREFAYLHPDMVAAAAPLGNATGYAAPAYSHESIVVDDQRIENWSKIDMPLITIGAAGEELSPHSIPSLILPDYDLFIEAWQRRLKASRAPVKTREQIMAAEHSHDYVTRLYGLPNDGSSLQMIDGVEHYIIDVKNIDGKNHMRFVAVDNMFHAIEPTMPMIAWTFMRRFARDQRTGKVIELY